MKSIQKTLALQVFQSNKRVKRRRSVTRVEKKGINVARNKNKSGAVPPINQDLETMNHQSFEGRVDGLIQNCKWKNARRLLEDALAKDSSNHWVLTQIGVTYYEQRKYQEALKWFEQPQAILNSCPLTLWNLAGTFDSLGRHEDALRIYVQLLRSDRSPADDPCWESEDWAESLKTDCVYRAGLCFEHLERKEPAWVCYWTYLNYLDLGNKGMYSHELVRKKLIKLKLRKENRVKQVIKDKLRQDFQSTLSQTGPALG